MPVYQKFVQAAKSLDPRYVVMVTPSRWFAGGAGSMSTARDAFGHAHARNSSTIPDATEAFPGMDIPGWRLDTSFGIARIDGPCNVQTIETWGARKAPLRASSNAYKVLVRCNTGVSILEKVGPAGSMWVNRSSQGISEREAVRPRERLTAARPRQRNAEACRTSIQNEGESWIARADIPRNEEWIDQWKVLLGRAYGERGAFPYWITSSPILGPGTACTETYLVIDRFDNEAKAKVSRVTSAPDL